MATSSGSSAKTRTKVKVPRKTSRKRAKRIFAFVTIVAVVVAVAVGLWRANMLPVNQVADDWYELTKQDIVLVRLPEDDAPHDDYTEWWYYNGHLEGVDGHQYSFHYTLFLLNALTLHTVIHASFIDEETGKRYTYQSRTGGNPSLDTKDHFNFKIGDWVMRGADGRDRLEAKTGDFSFNLSLISEAPPVFQGGTGLLDFREAGTSYYYSRTRMKIKGYAGLLGKEQSVEGAAWFDHQWGDFRTTSFGWEWFALQLDDGADIMLYQLYHNDGSLMLVSGSYTKDGVTRVLGENEVHTSAWDYWESPISKVSYPIGWNIELPQEQVKIVVTPVHRVSEFDGRDTTYNLYWEGAVSISGSHSGRGFLEVNPANQLADKR